MRCLLFFAFVVITSLSFANRWSITEGNLFVNAGTITGRLISDDGQPIANANITLKPTGCSITTIRRINTDDSGIYRLYGLPPGTYLIATGSRGQFFFFSPSAFDSDIPVYFPSSTRNTATEVTVHNGEEVTSIDIRYRSKRGQVISGTV